MTNENCCLFIVLNIKKNKQLIIISIMDKVTILFCILIIFDSFLTLRLKKYMRDVLKRHYHRSCAIFKDYSELKTAE